MAADKIARVLAKLEDSLLEGDFYGALQMYRTVIKRKVDGDALDEAQSLLVQGACTLCKHNKVLEAVDLGDMLLKTVLEAKGRPLTAAAVEALEAIFAAVPRPPAPAALSFAKNACRWASHAPVEGSRPEEEDEGVETEVGHPHRTRQAAVHLLAARLLAQAGPEHRPDALRHYLESSAPVEFATFLWSWGGDGYSTETDLFLARAVLQLLCLGNMRDANALRDEYYRLAGADPAAPAWSMGSKALDTPLCHFVRYLLLTLERDASPLFKVLLDKYSPSLSRDPSGDLQAYCATIGLRYFRIQPPKDGMAAMMENMMGMLGGGGGRGGGGGMPPGLAGLLAGGGRQGPGGMSPEAMMAELGGQAGRPFPFPGKR